MYSQQHSFLKRSLAAIAVYALLLPALPAQQQTQQQNQQQTQQQAAPPSQQTTPPAQQTQPPSTGGQQSPRVSCESRAGSATASAAAQRRRGDHRSHEPGADRYVCYRQRRQAHQGIEEENFQLDEDGKRQALTAVDYYDIEGIEKAAKSDDTTAPIVVSLKNAPDPEVVRNQVRDHRMIVLFFDMTSMQPEDLLRATDSAKKFLHDKMSPADLVAIVSFGSVMTLNTDFTNDRNVLYQAVARLIPGKDANLSGQATSASDTVTADDESAFSADDTEFNIYNTDRKLYAMETLSGMLGEFPARNP